MRHPAIIQLRGFDDKLSLALKIVERNCDEFEIEMAKNGVDIYISDVNRARNVISKLKRAFNFETKFSTKYAGLRKGRVRVLFVFSLRLSKV
ncbi:MAG: hypothetical protein J7K36_04865 [Archaeoglobaceae archaeon]|nr:hypothetical protein [Archaeoglobaceae archaeon]HDD36009.1 hypothetical protein [Archaeoglobus veneficus]